MKTFEIEVRAGAAWRIEYVEARTEKSAHRKAQAQSGFLSIYVNCQTLSSY